MTNGSIELPSPLGAFPVRSVVREGDAARTHAHLHSCGQLLYPQEGATLLETPEGVVRLGPDRAAWIPPGEIHSVLMDKRYRYHSLYIDARLSPRCGFKVLAIRPLLRELIVDAASWDDSDLGTKQKLRRAQVIIDEIDRATPRHASMRIPRDRKLAAIFQALEKDSSDARQLQHWADEVGASAKTLQRLFLAETGMSFQQWRNHFRMTRAVELHAQGWRLLDIAIAIGYSSEGAYGQAFKKFYGHPPSALRKPGPP